jgi:hypothetical protein
VGLLHFDTPDELCATVRPNDEIVVYSYNIDRLSSAAFYLDLARRTDRSVRRYSGGLFHWEGAGPPLEGMVRSPP